VPQKQYVEVCASKIDVYSLGFVILDLYLWSEYHEQVYKTNSPKAVIREMVINLIRGMVHFDPRRRSSSDDALAQLDDIIKLMECLKRPAPQVKNSPSAHGQKPKTKLNICIGKLVQ
jgi:serine/threonine protein kinase